jgi:hypothetical protein
MVEDITTGIKQLKKKVQNINEMQDIVEQKQQPIGQKMDGMIKRIKKDNDQLKVIIEKVMPAPLSSSPPAAASSSPSSSSSPDSSSSSSRSSSDPLHHHTQI